MSSKLLLSTLIICKNRILQKDCAPPKSVPSEDKNTVDKNEKLYKTFLTKRIFYCFNESTFNIKCGMCFHLMKTIACLSFTF